MDAGGLNWRRNEFVSRQTRRLSWAVNLWFALGRRIARHHLGPSLPREEREALVHPWGSHLQLAWKILSISSSAHRFCVTYEAGTTVLTCSMRIISIPVMYPSMRERFVIYLRLIPEKQGGPHSVHSACPARNLTLAPLSFSFLFPFFSFDLAVVGVWTSLSLAAMWKRGGDRPFPRSTRLPQRL